MPLDKEAADIITTSEAILKQFASRHSLTANAINDFNKNVLKHLAFNKDEEDTDMLQRLKASINRGDIQIINMHTEGNGEQVLELFMRQLEKVLFELMADMRLAGCQNLHFTSTRTRVATDFLQGTPTDQYLSISQIQVGEGTVQVSIVLYIDGTYLKKGIPILPVYHKCIHIIPDIMHDVMSDIISDVTFCLIASGQSESVISTMTDQ